MENLFDFVRNVYFFNDLDERGIKKIVDVCHRRTFNTGDVIFHEGDEANNFFIVLSGTVEVWKDYHSDEPDMLAMHTRGHLFGEMALVDELPRSATVIAREKTEVLYISREDFQKIISGDAAIALSIMKSVSSMVRKSNESFVEDLRIKNRNLEQANRELKEAQAELLKAERLSALGKLSSLILHDIRNPLSVLRGYAELITMSPEQTDRVKVSSVRIMNEADRINRLANELLDYSRGEIRLNISIVSVSALVERLLELIRDRFEAQNISLSTEVAFDGQLLLDKERILRALFNLADNARKAMPEGGIFKLHVTKKGKMVVWEMTDTGVGMSEEVQRHMFEPFYSFSKSGGTGLGMCIVKSIIEAHEGSLSFFSQPGEGTRFTISLPVTT
ncbi:MAG TPA: cyclic nucleotide-binding domain-containing protein [Spirochaetia bacterium]|nr:cyclic nucleotide-binding domain-containing protein [Spirochaetia bacterium]